MSHILATAQQAHGATDSNVYGIPIHLFHDNELPINVARATWTYKGASETLVLLKTSTTADVTAHFVLEDNTLDQKHRVKPKPVAISLPTNHAQYVYYLGSHTQADRFLKSFTLVDAIFWWSHPDCFLAIDVDNAAIQHLDQSKHVWFEHEGRHLLVVSWNASNLYYARSIWLEHGMQRVRGVQHGTEMLPALPTSTPHLSTAPAHGHPARFIDLHGRHVLQE